MIKMFKLLCLVVLAALWGCEPYGLTTEYRTDPVGIDCAVPRLSWKLPDGVVRQAAYGLKRPLEAADIVQCVISTDFRSVAEFHSSDPLLDRLVRADRSPGARSASCEGVMNRI